MSLGARLNRRTQANRAAPVVLAGNTDLAASFVRALARLTREAEVSSALGMRKRWDGSLRPADVLITSIEPYVREVATLEGLDADELLKGTLDLLDKYGDLWDRLAEEGQLK